MTFTIRTAIPEDHDYIVSWTADTFTWGDYVGDSFLDWLDDDQTEVMVAEVDGRAIAIGRAQLVSPTEAWSSAMR